MDSFPHRYNASMSQELLLLKTKCGLAGIAVYWHIREILYQNNGYITVKAYKNYIKVYGQGELEHVLTSISDYILTHILHKKKMQICNTPENGNLEHVFNTCSTRVLTGVQHVFMPDVLDDLKKGMFLKKIKAEAGRKSAENRRLRTRVKNILRREEEQKKSDQQNDGGASGARKEKVEPKEKKRLEAGCKLERSARGNVYIQARMRARESGQERSGAPRIPEDPCQVGRLQRVLLRSDSAIVEVSGTAQLVQTLCDEFHFPFKMTWAYVVQSRGKDNPVAYLARILRDPAFRPSDTAMQTAEQEMRSLKLV